MKELIKFAIISILGTASLGINTYGNYDIVSNIPKNPAGDIRARNSNDGSINTGVNNGSDDGSMGNADNGATVTRSASGSVGNKSGGSVKAAKKHRN